MSTVSDDHFLTFKDAVRSFQNSSLFYAGDTFNNFIGHHAELCINRVMVEFVTLQLILLLNNMAIIDNNCNIQAVEEISYTFVKQRTNYKIGILGILLNLKVHKFGT